MQAYDVRVGSDSRPRCAPAQGPLCPYQQTSSAWRGTSDKCRYGCKSLFGMTSEGSQSRLTRFAQRREGPYHFIQNRSRTSVFASKSDPAAEKTKGQFWRDFWVRSIFDFCNDICHKRTHASQQESSIRSPRRRGRVARSTLSERLHHHIVVKSRAIMPRCLYFGHRESQLFQLPIILPLPTRLSICSWAHFALHRGLVT